MRGDRSSKDPAAPADGLLSFAAELDPLSPGFAARLRAVAPTLAGELPPALVRAYAGALRRLVAFEGAGREAGQALLALALPDLAALAPADLEATCDAAEEIARHSVRAASTFVAGALPALAELSGDRPARLSGAAAAVVRLAERHGSDPAVQRFAAASAHALARHGGEVMAAWADFCEATAFGSRRTPDATARPLEVPNVADVHLAAAIRLAATVARRDRERGVRLFAHLPGEIARVAPEQRAAVLDLLGRLSGSSEALLDAVEVIGPVLRRVPRGRRSAVLDLAQRIADRLPLAPPRYLRSVLRVGDAIGFDENLAAFVDKGLELGAQEPAAGLAFFALETRGARAFLRRHDVAVVLEDVESTLRGYLHLITRSRPAIVASEARGLFPNVALDPATVPVSARTEIFPNWEENFALLKLQATLATLWEALGTRGFELARWLDEPEEGGLADLFRRFASPEAAAGLFAHLEAVRAMPLLRRLFPGLAADVGALRRRVFPGDRPPRAAGAAEAALFLSLDGDPARVAFAAPWGESLARLAELARRGEATVYDTVRATEQLCERLAAGELVPIYGIESFLDEDLALSYLLEEDDEARPGAADDARRDPDAPVDPRFGEGERSDETSPGGAVDPDLLRAYLEQHPDLKVLRSEEAIDAVGLFVSGLTGGGGEPERRERRGAGIPPESVLALARQGRRTRGVFLHDEWDYVIGDYRHQWCKVHEIAVDGDDGAFFSGTLQRYAEMLPEVRRQFQRVKPEGYRVIHGLLDGEDFDLNAVVMARGDLRARRTPSPKLYTARQREERDVATLFLLDMSASTDEETEPAASPAEDEAAPEAGAARAPRPRARRIIDIQKEALVIMAQALEEIGDQYAIYGFSGHGRDCVEFFDVKSFDEPLNQAVRARIGAIEPQRSTRMGAALRQATVKLRAVASRAKHLILLSDGFPQDFDYGDDRRSNVYGLRDTTMALREAAAAGVQPFCITVDRAGHDYLREMCDARRYLVIEDIASLPHELPKIYSEATRGA